MHWKLAYRFVFILFMVASVACGTGLAQVETTGPVDRIRGAVDVADRITLVGSRHPLAKNSLAVGQVPSGQPMDRMVLVLAPDAAAERALAELIRAQQDPASPEYHQWLTPQQFGERFGASANDVAQVMKWLGSNGFQIDETPSSRRAVVFSGTAGQVESAFHTSIQNYLVDGERHYANATNVSIPRALAGVVSGVVALHDFRSAAQLSNLTPAYTAANALLISLLPIGTRFTTWLLFTARASMAQA